MKGTSNGTKVKPAASAKEEECGIWLDTTEFKEKKQKKQPTRPISKLLNPLARSGGYSVAVALSFTQTKLDMPVTRQSTISSFFSPKPTDPKPSAGDVEMYTPLHTEACSGTKRKHEVTLEPSEETDITLSETSEVCQQNCDLDHEDVSVKDSDDRKVQSCLHFMRGYKSDEEEPPGKRRAFDNFADHNVLDTQEYLNKARSGSLHDIQTIAESKTLFHGKSRGLDPLMIRKPCAEACRDVLPSPCLKELQEFEDKHVLRDQNTTVEGRILTSRPVSANHRRAKAFANTNVDQEQSCYKPKASPIKLTGKENRQPASPIHSASPFKQNLISSPAKSRLKDKYTHSLRTSGNEESGTEIAGDSHALLYTQDSEGFCVIAHRDQHLRSPLKDHSNLSIEKDYWNSASDKSLDKEDEESDLDAEILFTQDSEGDIVIKH
ncbi:uncharacterized protein LOC130567353 [Triplophysa rosa]|uniref:Aurora kinase A and ninein-interacting protein-like n=1 Tax=Triplophysa rosa TaxID=992332 RepID=A0A9W7TLZ2_TRIRA|nr:uncharacterized protein LOC130567353 [Triplophysa rosa]KAI7798846.1 putative aurora kinase A and ninein-interacting protein-like [Triplophysa rosa]